MFDEKIKELEAIIKNLKAQMAQRVKDIRAALESDDLEEAKKLQAQNAEDKVKLAEAANTLSLYTASKSTPKVNDTEGHAVATEELTYRDKVNAFLRSKGAVAHEGLRMMGKDEVLISLNELNPSSDGIKRSDTKPVTREELITTPIREVSTIVDLKQRVNVKSTTKASGIQPVLKRNKAKMVSVAELEKNPALAKPEFGKVPWEIETYRGAIPISQEAIDDADVDLLSLVEEAARDIKINTTNDEIAKIFKAFEAKTIANLDELKKLLNVDLDPAYNVELTASQSFYNLLDTLKDKNGRYLMQDAIISPTGKAVLGKNIFTVNDELLGAEGEAKAFIGDHRAAVLFMDRLELGLRWVDHEIYGSYIQIVARFDVKQADEKAGYFVTFTP